MSEENVERSLAHPLSAVCSDGSAWAPYGPLSTGVPHPRTYGTFPRVLGRYVRERKLMPLETAIHKMTALPAGRVGLHDRGTVTPGARADLVAFDPDTVIDQATFEKPHQYPLGIPHVWVNGVPVIRGGEHTGARPGRSARPTARPGSLRAPIVHRTKAKNSFTQRTQRKGRGRRGPDEVLCVLSFNPCVLYRETSTIPHHTGIVSMHRIAVLAVLLAAAPAAAQEPASWGESLSFSTFSIAAVDSATGEVGVAVTTRVPCVGNAVPHVRAGVGAVATQATTRVEYGPQLLALLERGVSPEEALRQALAGDTLQARRQVGVIGRDGRSAQHTGTGTTTWAGHRAGRNFVTQGNLLVGPAVLDSVAAAFEASASSGRHLADRLIDALAAGQAAGGDARKGRAQSAAVVVADPRPGRSRRPDGTTADINVCEHAEPVAELRRIYNTISETLGFRTLQQQAGSDVWQLKLMLHALGHYRAGQPELARDSTAFVYTQEAVAAVDAFRRAEGLAGPDLGVAPGLVDAESVARLWAALERAGKAEAVRRMIHDLTAVRR